MTNPKTPAVEPRGPLTEVEKAALRQVKGDNATEWLAVLLQFDDSLIAALKDRDEARRDRDSVQRQFMALLDGIAQIHGLRGKTQLSDCCVAKTCIPHFTQQGEVSGCKWQAGVARGFNECADIAEQALAKLEEKS